MADKTLDYFTSLAGSDYLNTLPGNFNVRALERFAWELNALPSGAIFVELSPGKTYALVLKHPDGTHSLWWDSLSRLMELSREANAQRLWPMRRLQ